ncbi:MAG: hypothetical protein P1U82_25105 [Verrucomicrobiales bacterium]|nr:hypothetical protein [Verrucomicrobiales bacterium]
MKGFDTVTRDTYGDDIAAKVKLYEESTSERQERTAFKTNLTSMGLEIPFETEEQLMAIMYEERKAFVFAHNYNNPTDPTVLGNLNDDTSATIEPEYVQLHERFETRAGELLEGETLDVFQANQVSFRDLMVNSMRISQQMMGGGKQE